MDISLVKIDEEGRPYYLRNFKNRSNPCRIYGKIKNCKKCQKKFFTPNHEIRRGGGKFCSQKCGSALENNYFWNGGKNITKEGYIAIKSPSHPYANNNGYVLEHRLVMEKSLDRYLLKEENVHHINGIKNDNRPENLEILTNSEHMGLHMRTRVRDALGRLA